MNNLSKFITSVTFRILMSSLLIYTSIIKAIDPRGFFEFMINLGAPGNLFVYLYTISFIELSLGILLLIGCYYKQILWCIGGLFTFFCLIHIYAFFYDIDECSCTGGLLFQQIGTFSIIFNFIISFLSFFVIKHNADKLSLDYYTNKYALSKN